MPEAELQYLDVGEGDETRRIAVLRRQGTAPGVFWLGGFRSEMTGAKAGALDALGEETGAAVTRFDYSGHGQSEGDFIDFRISQARQDMLDILAAVAPKDDLVLIGSSMGGWMTLLAAGTLEARVKAMLLIAPALLALTVLVDVMREATVAIAVQIVAQRALKETLIVAKYRDRQHGFHRGRIPIAVCERGKVDNRR